MLLLPLLAQVEEPSEWGSLRLVNAMAQGKGNLMVKIDGELSYSEGYSLGQRTGAMVTKQGAHTVKMDKQGVVSEEVRVVVEPQSATTLITYAEKVLTPDQELSSLWEGRVLQLKQRDPKGHCSLTIVSVCEQEELDVWVMMQSQEGGLHETVFRKQTAVVDLAEKKGVVRVVMKDTGGALCQFYADQLGSYVVVLYNDEQGEVRGLSYCDPKEPFTE